MSFDSFITISVGNVSDIIHTSRPSERLRYFSLDTHFLLVTLSIFPISDLISPGFRRTFLNRSRNSSTGSLTNPCEIWETLCRVFCLFPDRFLDARYSQPGKGPSDFWIFRAISLQGIGEYRRSRDTKLKDSFRFHSTYFQPYFMFQCKIIVDDLVSTRSVSQKSFLYGVFSKNWRQAVKASSIRQNTNVLYEEYVFNKKRKISIYIFRLALNFRTSVCWWTQKTICRGR